MAEDANWFDGKTPEEIAAALRDLAEQLKPIDTAKLRTALYEFLAHPDISDEEKAWARGQLLALPVDLGTLTFHVPPFERREHDPPIGQRRRQLPRPPRSRRGHPVTDCYPIAVVWWLSTPPAIHHIRVPVRWEGRWVVEPPDDIPPECPYHHEGLVYAAAEAKDHPLHGRIDVDRGIELLRARGLLVRPLPCPDCKGPALVLRVRPPGHDAAWQVGCDGNCENWATAPTERRAVSIWNDAVREAEIVESATKPATGRIP